MTGEELSAKSRDPLNEETRKTWFSRYCANSIPPSSRSIGWRLKQGSEGITKFELRHRVRDKFQCSSSNGKRETLNR